MKIKSFISNNFGDQPLNKYLYEKITGKNASFVDLDYDYNQFHYMVSGSILSKSNVKSIIWGSGFIQQNAYFKEAPQRIYAVRGKLTWEMLNKKQIKVPYIFGDPCLLLPRFFNPKMEKKYEVGIIPHYSEIDSLLVTRLNGVKVIDICKDVETVVTEVLQCKKILSSSLHGLILADAYKIPNLWLGIDNLIQGIGFKYFDYFSTTNRNPAVRFQLEKGTKIEKTTKHCKRNKITVDLDKLWEVCPLRRED